MTSQLQTSLVQEIHKTLRLFVSDGSVFELRILATQHGTISGYFDDIQAAAEATAPWNGKTPAIYFTPNPVVPALIARSANRLQTHVRTTTSDVDILRREWFLNDFDPVRPAGISSTNREHAAALERAKLVRMWLTENGWPEPVLADSGNGGHLCYPVDLPNDMAATELLKRCLHAIDLVFSDNAVVIDTTTFNAARIWKLYGTKACKGDSTGARPHRVAHVLEIPDQLVPVGRDLLETLSNMAPEPQQRQARPSSTYGSLNLAQWLADHDLEVALVAPWQGGKKWVLSTCPWNSEHMNRSAFVVQFPNGAIAAGCHHNSCQGKDWSELRTAVEPGWQEKQKTDIREGASKSQASRLVEMALDQGLETFHDQRQEPFVCLPMNKREIWPVNSLRVRRWLAGLLWKEEEKAPSGEALSSAINVLSSKAVFDGEQHHLHIRVACHDEALWYDLSDWRAVKTAAMAWEVVEHPPILFRHFSHQRPQVEPRHNGNFDLLFNFISPTRTDDDVVLLGVATIAALIPGSPRPAISLAGPQGSGKSPTAKMVKRLVDPSFVSSIRRIADFREIQLQLEQNWLLSVDNVTSLPPDISDALAAAITGDGDMRRQLYTDQDIVLLTYMRPMLLNGITHAAQRPDLLDRTILINLQRIPELRRLEEEEMWPAFERDLPAILGGAFDILATAVALRPQVQLAVKPRMADFAAWGYAIAEAAGWGGSRFLAAYERNVSRQHEEAVSASVVAQTVVGFMEGRDEWQGPASTLKPLLDETAMKQGIDPRDRRSGWPQDAARLAKELRRMADTLAAVGVEVSFPAMGKRRSIRFRTTAENNVGTVGTVDVDMASADGSTHHTDGREGTVPSYADAADGTDGKNRPSSGDVLEI
ncbi:hypothetical protein ACFLX9_02685 [Chloroflexota bacterium]